MGFRFLKVSSSVLMMATLAFGSTALAAWVASDRSREVAADLALAISKAGVQYKVAAAVMGLSDPQMTEQLAGRQPMNLFRLTELFAAHPEVEVAYYSIRAERRGLIFIASQELAEIVRAAALFSRSVRSRARVVRGVIEEQVRSSGVGA